MMFRDSFGMSFVNISGVDGWLDGGENEYMGD